MYNIQDFQYAKVTTKYSGIFERELDQEMSHDFVEKAATCKKSRDFVEKNNVAYIRVAYSQVVNF